MFRLTPDDAIEVMHRLSLVLDQPDLQADYGLSKDKAEALYDSVPAEGGWWTVPAWAADVVAGELSDHADLLRETAEDARASNVGQALSMCRQAARLERIARAVSGN